MNENRQSYSIQLAVFLLSAFFLIAGCCSGNTPLLADPDPHYFFPFWVKITYTVFLSILVPIYWKHWGPANFLWFSDVALFGIGAALWLESPLLASMMAVGVLLPEIYWNIELFIRLLTGHNLLGLADYMWNREKSLYLRLLSLFHVVIPIFLIWMLSKWGYEPSALYYQTLLAWIMLLLSYKFSPKSENINWVYGFGKRRQSKIRSVYFLGMIMVLYPLLLFLPTHFLLKALF